MSFKKNDIADGKVDLTIFPTEAIEGVSRILEFGARKYARDNWRRAYTDPQAQRRMLAAMLRHYTALAQGETLDPESGESHVLHMCCNAVFLATFSEMRRRAALAEKRDRTAVEDMTGTPTNSTYDGPYDAPTNSSHGPNTDAICNDPYCEVCF